MYNRLGQSVKTRGVHVRLSKKQYNNIDNDNNNNNNDDEEKLSLMVVQACALINDALNARDMLHSLEPKRLKWWRRMHTWYWYYGSMIVCLMQLSLAFFEQPATDESAWTYPTVQCVELGLLSILLIDIYIMHYALGQEYAKDSYKWIIRLLCIVVLMLFNIISVAEGKHAIGAIRIIRVLICITYEKSLYNALKLCCVAVTQSLRLFILMSLFVVFSAIIAFVLFSQQADDTNDFFDTFDGSCYTLLLFLIGSDFPTMMLRGLYEQNHYNAIFFVLYFIVAVLIFINMLLAMVSTAFSQHVRHLVRYNVQSAQARLVHAYHVLRGVEYTNPSMMNRRQESQFKTFVTTVIGYFSLPYDDENMDVPDIELDTISSSKYEINMGVWLRVAACIRPDWDKFLCVAIWNVLDKDKDGQLSFHELLDIVRFFSSNITVDFVDIDAEEDLTSTWFASLRKFCRQIESYRPVDWPISVLEFCIDIVVGVNLVFLIMEVSDVDLSVYNTINIICVCVYLIELCIKLLALGTDYFDLHINKLDFAITIIAVAVSAVILFSSSASPNRFPQAIRLIRLFRWGRLLSIFDITFETLFSVFTESFGGLLAILVLIFYVYGIIGQELFATTLTNASPTSTYSLNGWNGLNFNTFPNALMTLFVAITSTSNWVVIMNATIDVTKNTHERLYFLSFTIVVVFIVLSLVTSFMLDSFFYQYREAHRNNDAAVLGSPNSDLKTQLETQWLTPLAASSSIISGGGGSNDNHRHKPVVRVDERRNLLIGRVFGEEGSRRIYGLNF